MYIDPLQDFNKVAYYYYCLLLLLPIIIIIIIIVIVIIIIIIIIKATSKTQKLILIYTEVNIYFVSWTKVSLNNRPSSKALNRQNWKKQSSKLPPH